MTETRATPNAWAIILILVLGFCLRLTGLTWGQGYSYFSAVDSMEAYRFGVNFAVGEPRAQYIDQPNYNEHAKLPGPLWNLFCFATAEFWGSADGIIVATILLNTAAIYLTYLLAERTIGSPGSLCAALLMATLPYPVYFSAFAYNPNVMPFLGALLFLALWDVVRKDRSRRIFWVSFLPLLMCQFHLSGLSLLPAIVILLALAPVRLNIPWLLAGIGSGSLLYFRYLEGEMAHGWQNSHGMLSGRNGHWWGGLKALIAPLDMLGNFAWQWTDNSFEEYKQFGRACFGSVGVLLALNLLSGLIAVALLAGAFRGIAKASRGFWRSPREAFKNAPGLLFLGILLIVPLFCCLVSRQTFRSRYAIVVFPPLMCLAGYAVVKWAAHPKFGRAFVGAMVVLTCANIYFMPAMYLYDRKDIEHGEKFHASFRALESIYQRLKTNAGTGSAIKVENVDFTNSPAKDNRLVREAWLIPVYVDIREKESAAVAETGRPSATYTLRDASKIPPGETDIVYNAHGVALLAPHPVP
jgi:hypothetical protein